MQLHLLQVVGGYAWGVNWQEIAVFLERQVFDALD